MPYLNKLKKIRRIIKIKLSRAIIFIPLKTKRQIMMIVLSYLSNQIKRWSNQIITCYLRKVSMVKSSKLFQAIHEILSLRRAITSASNHLHNKNK